MRAPQRLLLLALAVLGPFSLGCWTGGGCPYQPADEATLRIEPGLSCLSLHVYGSEDEPPGTHGSCVGGVDVVGHNGCPEPLVVSTSSLDGSTDGGLVTTEQTFASGADVRFFIAKEGGQEPGNGTTRWLIPASVGEVALVLNVTAPHLGR